MNRRTLLTCTSAALLAGCSDLVNRGEEGPESYQLVEVLVVNKHAASSHEVEMTVVADEERVYEETVELAPEGESGSRTEVTCEFGGVTSPFEVRAALPNGTEGSVNGGVNKIDAKMEHLQAVMLVRNSGDIDSNLYPVETHSVPDC